MTAMPSSGLSTRLRRKLGRLLGARAPALQVAALCRDPATGRILMITSRGTGRWIIPKGWPMTGRSLIGAALQEAWEEAGVRAAAGPDLGIYHYDKMQDHGFAIPVEVRVFLADVTDLADDYPEAGKRTRRWFTPPEAAELVAEPELSALILGLAAVDDRAGLGSVAMAEPDATDPLTGRAEAALRCVASAAASLPATPATRASTGAAKAGTA